MEPLTLNVIIVVVALASCWYQVKMYRILRSPAFTLMAAAMLYLTAFRIALPIWPWITNYGLILPFYVLILAHTVYLYQILNRYLTKRK